MRLFIMSLHRTQKSKFLLLVSLSAMACSVQARADEKGDAMLRQVHQRALALSPLVGEYTVTQHDPAGDKVEKYTSLTYLGGSGQSGGGILPFGVFNLLDPLPSNAVSVTRYLGPQTVAGETFETVELKRGGLTLTLYVGSDGLIHRGHTVMGALRPPPLISQLIDPKTGRPALPPDQLAQARIAPPTKTDAHRIDFVVTEYRKARQFPPRPALPPPLTTRRFPNLSPQKNHAPIRIALSPEGSRLMVAFADGTAEIVDTATGASLTPLSGTFGLDPPLFSPDGKLLAACTPQQTLALYETATGRLKFALPGGIGRLRPVFSPDSKRLAVVDSGTAVRVWDTATGHSLLSIPEDGLTEAQFSPDSQFLTTFRQAGGKWLLRRGNVDTGVADPEREFPAGRWYGAIALAPDGKWLIVGVESGGLAVYDAQTGAKTRDLPDSDNSLYALQFAADGKTLIAISRDSRGDMPSFRESIAVWDTTSWQVIGSGDLPSDVTIDAVCPLCIALDGKTVACSSLSGGVRIWAVPTK